MAAYALLKGGGLSQTGAGITGKFSDAGFAGSSYKEMTNKPGMLRSWLGAGDNVYKDLTPMESQSQRAFTNTFNGIQLPAIATYAPETDEFKVIREFGYQDYKTRLS